MPAVTERLADDARALFEAAVRAVQADRIMAGVTAERLGSRPLEAYRRIVALGIGKAAMTMAGVLERQFADRQIEGAVVVPRAYPQMLPAHLPAPRRIAVLEGEHPVPGAGSLNAGARLLELAASCNEVDLLVALVSGGGPALPAAFADGISLADAQRTFELLLTSGADIHAMNAVRKHLSRLGGGQLARAAHPAEVAALVVSDVVGDDLATIASGPTAPDPATFDDAAQVLRDYGLWSDVPAAVRRHLEAGQRGERAETPKPGDPLFDTVRTTLIGTNRHALEAARAEAGRRGYAVRIAADDVTGEAREVGTAHAEAVRAVASGVPTCLLWGGEPTVTVRGGGKGGRNQELALAAAIALEGAPERCLVLSGGTDGIDGPTDAAGAWATPRTARRARRQGLDPKSCLDNNDSYAFFDALGNLLRPGPTHTNVMDLHVALVQPA